MKLFKNIKVLSALIALASAVLLPIAAGAGETDEFHAAQHDAYGHYRQAVFYTRTGNTMTAAFELEAFGDKWAKIVSRYAGKPPAAYARDAKWRETLEEVAKRIDLGLAAADDGDVGQLASEIKPIRGLLAKLRRRNNVVIYSDHIDAANLAFRRLFEYRRNPPDLSDPAQVSELRDRLKKTISAYEKCRDEAPDKVAKDEQFQRLMEDSLFYLNRIHLAIEEKNQLNVVNILRRVVSSDKLLWLLFG